MNDAMIYLVTPAEGVCIGGRWHGWLMNKHPDGYWVSVRKLDAVNPYDALPEWLRTLTPRSKTDD